MVRCFFDREFFLDPCRCSTMGPIMGFFPDLLSRSNAPVWIGCSQNLNVRFRQNVICQIVWLHKISTFAFSKSRFFTFTKHYKALLFQRRRWANRFFFLQKIKIAPIWYEIPALSLSPCIPYRNLDWYRNASIPFRFKYRPYRSHSGNTGANTEFWIPDF